MPSSSCPTSSTWAFWPVFGDAHSGLFPANRCLGSAIVSTAGPAASLWSRFGVLMFFFVLFGFMVPVLLYMILLLFLFVQALL